MQIIDSNDFNLRTAAYLLKNQDLEFLIIPVLHIGSTEFYQEVITELNKCDLILFEGVGLKKLKGFRRAYQQFAKRVGLVYQGDEINMKRFGAKLIHADFNRNIAEQEWKRIPLISRLLFRTIYPIGLFWRTTLNCAFLFFLWMQLLLLRCEYVGNSARVFHIFTSVRLDF